MQTLDKRKGRKTVRERFTVSPNGNLPAYSLEDSFQIFLNVKRANNLKDRTLKGYEQNLSYFNDWVKDNFSEATVNDITIELLRKYVLWCAEEKEYYGDHPFKAEWDKERRGLSPASVNVRIRVLKVFFSTLAEEGIIGNNPANKLALMRTEQDTVKPLTEDEIHRLLSAPNQKFFSQFRDYVIMVLMLDTGMRINEICAIEVNDVDLRSRQIILPASKNKNRKTRILPLSPETVKLLMQLITETRANFNTDYVFNTYYGQPVNEKTIQKAFYKYAMIAGIDKRVSPHVLRHNFAKMAAMNGMDIFTLMRLMGHSDISTTRKYVQIDDEDIMRQHMQFSPLQRIFKRS